MPSHRSRNELLNPVRSLPTTIAARLGKGNAGSRFDKGSISTAIGAMLLLGPLKKLIVASIKMSWQSRSKPREKDCAFLRNRHGLSRPTGSARKGYVRANDSSYILGTKRLCRTVQNCGLIIAWSSKLKRLMKRSEFGEIVESDDPGVEAAARVIYEASQFHHWSGFNKPFDELDPIGKIEFMAIVDEALKAADAARRVAGEMSIPFELSAYAIDRDGNPERAATEDAVFDRPHDQLGCVAGRTPVRQ